MKKINTQKTVRTTTSQSTPTRTANNRKRPKTNVKIRQKSPTKTERTRTPTKRTERRRMVKTQASIERAPMKRITKQVVGPRSVRPPQVKRVKPTRPITTQPIRRRTSTADVLNFISQALNKSWDDYLICLDRFQQTPSRKNVHDLRVSIRRFTTVMDLVDRFNPDNMIRRARIMLKEQLSELSTLRDVHVEMARVSRFLKEVPEMKSFYDDLRSKESNCLKAAKKLPWKPNRRFIETAVNRAKIKLNARRTTTTTDSARQIVETSLDVAFDGLSKKLEPVTLADYTTIHKVRLAFKPVRYMLEMLQAVLPLDRRQLRTVTLLSRIMGQIQDLEVLMKDLVEFRWREETVLSAVLEIWLDLERRKTETAQRFIKALPKFGEIWKPIIHEQSGGASAASKTLYVLRHGIAIARGDASYPLDSDRPLTPKGIKRMKRVASGMRRLKISFDVMLTSPYKRALETAFVLGQQYGVGEMIQTCTALTPEVLPEEVIRILQEKYSTSRQLLLIGHEPQLSALISTMTSGSAGARPLLKKGGLCKLQVDKLQPGKCATLLWLLTPRQLVNIT